MKTALRLVALSLLASGAFFTTSLFACSSGQWQTTAAGATAGDPSTSIARVAGKCGLKVTGTGLVVDNTPDGEVTFIARFYFFGKNIGAGTREIFSAWSADAGSGLKQFKVTYNGTNVVVDASDGGGGTATAAAIPNKWNLIEVEWTTGGAGSLWVNADAAADAASDTFDSGTGSIGSVKLGAITDIGANTALFDDYVSHRSSPVGPVLSGDGNSDTNINSGDVNVVVNEFLFNNLSSGYPDCNLDGAVNSGDINCIVAIFLNL